MPNVTDNGPALILAEPSANYEPAMEAARLLGNNWRTGRANQRKLAQRIVLLVAVDGYAFGPLKDDVRAKLGKLSPDDAKGLKSLFSTCGYIAEGWHRVPQEMKDAFIKGELVYSTLSADMRKAEKEREKAEADAAEAERLSELGIDVETDTANKARAADSDANVAAVERVLAMLASDTPRTEAETSAMARLFDTVAAFTAETLAKAA